MGENSKIEWTDHTFNPWTGCSKISPACAHCYAEAWAKRSGIVKWGDSALRRKTSAANWRKPLKWNKQAAIGGERKRVFCASLADVFEDRPEVVEWRKELFALIRKTPMLDWLLLTKRPENILRLMGDALGRCIGYSPRLPNVWLGTTVEGNDYRKRIAELVKCRQLSKTLFLSCEPLLGPLDISEWVCTCPTKCGEDGSTFQCTEYGTVDWVIAGGESGGGSRPSHPDWFRSLRDQCVSAGIKFHFKQWGEWVSLDAIGASSYQPFNLKKGKILGGALAGRVVPVGYFDDKVEVLNVGKKAAGRILDGRTWDEFP